MAGLAMADKLQSQDGTTVLYDNLNGAGPKLQDTGGTILLYNAVGDALGPKATDSGGTITFIPGLFGLFGGGTVIDNAPWGTVPLTIVRDGQDIKISWDAVKAPGAQIYVLTGDGTGKFQKNDPTAWKPYTDASFANQFTDTNIGAGVLVHRAQVGSAQGINWPNNPEAYYIGLQSGVTPTTVCQDPDPLYNGKPCYQVAPAVGKVNITCDPGLTWITYPFSYSDKSLNNVFGLQLAKGTKASADIILRKPSAGAPSLQWAYLDSSSNKWQDYDNTSQAAQFTASYIEGNMIWNRSANTEKITLVGDVPSEASLSFANGTGIYITFFGLGIPVRTTLDGSGLNALSNKGTKATADIILKKPVAGAPSLQWAYLDSATGKWQDYDNPTDPVKFDLTLPFGFYYWNRGANAINWTRKP